MALFHVASQPEMDKNFSIYAQERFTREQKWDEGIKIFLLYVKKINWNAHLISLFKIFQLKTPSYWVWVLVSIFPICC